MDKKIGMKNASIITFTLELWDVWSEPLANMCGL